MSEKYCPAGKCECENYFRENNYEKCKVCLFNLGMWTPEVCPWPSQQMKVEPQVNPLNPLGEKSKAALQPTMTDDDSPNVACYRLGYDVGFKIGIKLCIEAVEKLEKCSFSNDHYSCTEVIAAIDSIQP